MKNSLNQSEERFINKMQRILKSVKPGKTDISRKKARIEAQKIIERIPEYLRNHYRYDHHQHHITLYQNYKKDLKENYQEPYPDPTYKMFQTGTTCYYLCRYLEQLNMPYSVWVGEISIK